MARAFFKGHVESMLGSREKVKETEVPFDQREEVEQALLLAEIHDLTAERSSLGRDVDTKTDTVKKKLKAWNVRPFGGRMVPIPHQADEVASDEDEKKAEAAAQERLWAVKKRLKVLGKIPGIHEAYEDEMMRAYIIMRCFRHWEQSKRRVAEIDQKITQIRSETARGRGGALTGKAREQVKLLETEKEELQKKTDAFEAYDLGHAMARIAQIKIYAEEYAKGRMIEVPSVKGVVDKGLENLRRHQPFLLAGHLGTGKTELARHIAKLFMMENGVGFDPATETDMDAVYNKLTVEFFSGAEEASVYDLVGKLKITGRASITAGDLEARVQEVKSAMEKAKIDVPRDEIAKLLTGKSDVIETIFSYGPLGRALRDGRPIIFDEVNRIPPEITARLNDIMTRRVGDRIRLQENGEEEMTTKPGFAILGTCNLGAQYHGIKEVDAAFKSRWVARELLYPEVDETYDLILAALVSRDRVRLPKSFPAEAYEQLVDLAVATREIQEIFTGETKGKQFMAIAGRPVAQEMGLEKSVISTRDLMRKIVEVWRETQFSRPLDEVIVNQILASEVYSKDDRKFMTEIFIRRGFFRGWNRAKFKTFGIGDISQLELDTLLGEMGKDTFVAGDAFAEILNTAKKKVSTPAFKSQLLIGNAASVDAAIAKTKK